MIFFSLLDLAKELLSSRQTRSHWRRSKLVLQAFLESVPAKQAQQRKAGREGAACLGERFLFWQGWKPTEGED